MEEATQTNSDNKIQTRSRKKKNSMNGPPNPKELRQESSATKSSVVLRHQHTMDRAQGQEWSQAQRLSGKHFRSQEEIRASF